MLFGYDRDRNLYIKYMISDHPVNVNRCCARNGQNFGFLAPIRSRNRAFLHKSRIYLSSKYQLGQLDNVLAAGQLHQGCDRLYIPRIAHTTVDIDIHDVAVDSSGQVIFISF